MLPMNIITAIIMKKIGFLYGEDAEFSVEVMNNINSRGIVDIVAEKIVIGAVGTHATFDWDLIFDRVSEFVPYYASFLKYADLNGSLIINSPFSKCGDDDFFRVSLAGKLGIRVPKTAIIPCKQLPHGVVNETLTNLEYPLNWDAMFDYVGFPAYIKPNQSSGFFTDFKVYNKFEFFSAYDLTGSSVMIMQEAIEYDEYYRCFVIGKKNAEIFKYDPHKPLHLRYYPEETVVEESLQARIKNSAIRISEALGFDLNVVEFAVKDGKEYAVVFHAPHVLLTENILYKNNYDRLIKAVSDYLVEAANSPTDRRKQCCWRPYVS